MTAVSEFADKLLDAVKERKGLAPLSDAMDLDEATALDVQEAVVQARVDAGSAQSLSKSEQDELAAALEELEAEQVAQQRKAGQ